MAVAEELQIIIDAKVDQAIKKLKQFDDQTGKTTKKSNAFAKSLLAKFGAAAVAAKSIQLITKFTMESAQAASDAEEIFSKFATVFADVASEASGAAEQLANDFGLASSTAQKLIGDTGDLLTGFGLTSEEALTLSDTTNRLALDLASFTNAQGGAEAVSRALTSAYSGEREALKTYGIVISEAAVQAKILEQAQSGLTFETEQQAKIAATLAIAQEQSKNAIGDYARTADSAANVQRTLGEQTKRLKENYGALVLEGLTPVRTAFRNILSAVNDNIEKNKELRDALEYLKTGGKEAIEAMNTEQLETSIAAVNDQINKLQQQSLAGTKRSVDLLIEKRDLLQEQLSTQKVIDALRARGEGLDKAEAERLAQLEARQKRINAVLAVAEEIRVSFLSADEKDLIKTREQLVEIIKQKNILKDIGAFRDENGNITEAGLSVERQVLQLLGEESELVEKISKLYEDKKDSIKGTTEIAAEGWRERREAILLEVQLEEDLIAFREEQAAREAELNRDKFQETLDSINTIYNAYSGFYSALTSLRDNAHQKELNAIDEEIQAAKDAGDDTTALEQEKQDLITSYKKKAWEADKRGKLLQAAISTAGAVAEALPNVFLAAAVGALGAAQVATISATSNPYRTGGIINEPVVGTGQRTGQQYSFGEAGPEMVSPTSGGGGDDLHVVINLDGQVISKFVTKATRNRQILVDQRAVV